MCNRLAANALLLALAGIAGAAELGGHVKGRVLLDALPSNSVLRDSAGNPAETGESEVRLRFSALHDRWRVDVDYQAYGIVGDAVRIADAFSLPGGPATFGVLDDRRRWFDLTDVVSRGDDYRVLHRLDRASVTWTSDKIVVRFGRQALSWGGGLFFSPFDIVNPFDPAAVDTEYKTGDDMLYAQALRPNGDDLQFASVQRRDPLTGDLEADAGTTALKYHGIAGESEYDLLVARNRGRTTIGAGGNLGIGGAVLRADLVVADADDWTVEALANLSYSWTGWGRNITGGIEYYYNGWGLAGPYDAAALAAKPELLERLAAGETFTLGRHYVAAGMTVELTPLTLLTPNLFANLNDPSALVQLVLQHSLGDNLSVVAAVSVPLGPDGSEYGGVDAGPGRYLSRDAGLFAQIAWYF